MKRQLTTPFVSPASSVSWATFTQETAIQLVRRPVVEEARQIECRIVHGFEQGIVTGVDLSTASFINGEREDLADYLNCWITEEIGKRQESLSI